MPTFDVTRIPRWLLLSNLVLIGLAGFFAVTLIRDLARSQALPPQPRARDARPAAAGAEPGRPSPTADDKLETYNIIVAKYLFNPSRSEGSPAQATPAVLLPPKPLLHGIVLDGDKSRAYLEDPSTRRVLSYRVGDAVAGGELLTITADRVSIRRSDGQMNVMLMDPTKPRPAAPSVQEGRQPGPNGQPRTNLQPGAVVQSPVPQAGVSPQVPAPQAPSPGAPGIVQPFGPRQGVNQANPLAPLFSRRMWNRPQTSGETGPQR